LAHEGDWLVALVQDSGRGRQGRAWQSASGNFSGSTIVELLPGDPTPTTLALAAGLALIEAIDGLAGKSPLILKWPNDLLLDGAKLAGILLERSGDRIVAGFGVNLSSSPSLPDRPTATLGGAVTPQDFAPLLAATFARRLDQWRSGAGGDLGADWLARAHPIGTALNVHVSAAETIRGTFAGLEVDGALRLQTDRGLEIVRAGDVAL